MRINYFHLNTTPGGIVSHQYSVLTTDWTTVVWFLVEAKDLSSSFCIQTG